MPRGTLYDVVLPGTHDSGAYAMRADLLSRGSVLPLRVRFVRRVCAAVQRDFALTQSLDVLGQLRAGARFLDLRVSKRPRADADPAFWIVHGMVLCVRLADVLHAINRFHGECARRGALETVVTVVRTYHLDEEEVRELAAVLRNELRHRIYDGSEDDLRRDALDSLPPNVVAGALPGFALNLDWGRDAWMDTYRANRKINFLKRTLISLKHKEVRNNLFVLGWTVTPSIVDVTLRIVSMGLLRPAVLANGLRMNERFPDFFKSFRQTLQTKCNVIFFDCFGPAQAKLVQTLNARSARR